MIVRFDPNADATLLYHGANDYAPQLLREIWENRVMAYFDRHNLLLFAWQFVLFSIIMPRDPLALRNITRLFDQPRITAQLLRECFLFVPEEIEDCVYLKRIEDNDAGVLQKVMLTRSSPGGWKSFVNGNKAQLSNCSTPLVVTHVGQTQRGAKTRLDDTIASSHTGIWGHANSKRASGRV